METVQRHRTAITRQGLSTPMQALARYGVLKEGNDLFDYGCGQGDDIAALRNAGIVAHGWDPYYFPDSPLKKADIVNLGFVLNVVEEPAERVQAIQCAFSLARQCLAVGVLIQGRGRTEHLQRYGDGYVTKRGTFQKYFTQSEIKDLIERTVGAEAIAVTPGIFFIFADKLAEQRFLRKRHRRTLDISHLLTVPARCDRAGSARDAVLIEAHRDLIDAVWEQMLQLGRLPEENELEPSMAQGILARLKSFRKAARLAQQVHDAGAFSQIREARIEDLKLYFALNLFNKRKAYKELPSELRRDVKAFFGSHRNAVDGGRSLLFSLGEAEVIYEACRSAAEAGLGYLDGSHSLQLHAGLIDRLPAILRAYVGCAEKLYGDIRDVDLVKIHINSAKLSLLRYKYFDESPLPRLIERIKIKMRAQDLEFFEYGPDVPIQILYMKSRYMAPDQPGYARQKRFDEKLMSLNMFDFSRFGPSTDEFVGRLKAAGIGIDLKGFRITSCQNEGRRT